MPGLAEAEYILKFTALVCCDVTYVISVQLWKNCLLLWKEFWPCGPLKRSRCSLEIPTPHFKNHWISWAAVAHAYNPSYSGSRDQKDCGWKPAQGNSSRDPILKKPITKKGWWSSSRCRPWVQTPVPPKRILDEGDQAAISHHSNIGNPGMCYMKCASFHNLLLLKFHVSNLCCLLDREVERPGIYLRAFL
jgi:hypothetical protein